MLMGRKGRLLLALGLVATACGSGGEAAGDGASEPASRTTTTTTTLAATATTTEEAPVGPLALDGPGPLELGATYAVDFFVPVQLSVDQEGWVARYVFGEAVALSFGDSALVFLAITPEAEPEEVLDAILNGGDTISVVREPSVDSLGAWSVSTVDVVIPEQPLLGCGGPAVWALGRGGPPGATLRTVGDRDFGIVQCRTTRIWAIDVGGQVVTVLGVASEDERFDEFMPVLEDFLANHVAFGDDDG